MKKLFSVCVIGYPKKGPLHFAVLSKSVTVMNICWAWDGGRSGISFKSAATIKNGPTARTMTLAQKQHNMMHDQRSEIKDADNILSKEYHTAFDKFSPDRPR